MAAAAAIAQNAANPPCSTLFVANMGKNSTEAEMINLFARYVDDDNDDDE